MQGVFVTVYGRSKTGKSTCTGAAGAAGLFIADGGGLLPLRSFLGIESVNTVAAHNVQEAAELIEKHASPELKTIVVDDFSLLVERTIGQLEKTHSFGDMWRALRAQVLRCRDAARSATEKGTTIIFNCHESPPKVSSGKAVRGGPAMPGQLPEQFSAFSDIVARVKYDETAAPWKFVLTTVSDAEFIGGDRLSIFPPNAPMNVAEALRAAGYNIPYPKGMEWAEGTVAKLAKAVEKNGLENWRETLKPAADTLMKKHSPQHTRWVIQDALHRAILTNSRKGMVSELFAENDSW